MGNEKIRIEHILSSDRTGDGDKLVSANAGDSLTQNVPLLYDADGNVISTATRTGNTTNYATATAGGKTTGNYPQWDADGNLTNGDTGGGGGSGHDEAGIYLATAPSTSGWSWVNQGSSTVAQNAFGAITLIPQTQSGFQARMYVRAVPGGSTWKLRMLIAHYPSGSSSSLPGFCLRESGTGKIVSYVLADNAIFLATKWDSPSSFNANYGSTGDFLLAVKGNVWYWEIDWQATNRVITVSSSGLQNAGDGIAVHSVARNDFATTAYDQVGIFSSGNFAHTFPPVVTLLSYGTV